MTATLTACRRLSRPHAAGCLALALATGLSLGCATATSAPEAVEPAVEEIYHEALHWSRNSAEHRAIFEQTYALAGKRIETLADGRDPGTWAVSIDADETLLDNSLYEVEINQRGETFSQESWSEWVQRREATALPSAVAFAAKVKEMGGVVGVVTNRRSYNCAATADNLRQVGIPFDVVLCRHEEREKELRWDALSAGAADTWPEAQRNGSDPLPELTILLWLGDNVGDFPLQDQEIRHSEQPLSEFGNRFFIFPNPMYGSWEENPKQ